MGSPRLLKLKMKAGARVMERVYEKRITTIAELEEALQEISNQAYKQLFAGEDYVVEGWQEPREEKEFLEEAQREGVSI